jgi:hypothetical protein
LKLSEKKKSDTDRFISDAYNVMRDFDVIREEDEGEEVNHIQSTGTKYQFPNNIFIPFPFRS